MMALHKRKISGQPPGTPPGRTIQFDTAMKLCSMLSDDPALYGRLEGLNQLRNDLVSSGVTAIQLGSQGLIAADAIRCIGEFIQQELGEDPGKFFEVSVWSSAVEILKAADPERERALQQKLRLHRAMFKALNPNQVRERQSTFPEGEEPFVELDCPACSYPAVAFISDTEERDHNGIWERNVSVTTIACPVCELKLEGQELERFEYLAKGYLQDKYEEDEYEEFQRLVLDPDT